ncbi:MAG: ribosome small subunit-dependent GTPase A [Flavobacteriales bacterium]|nr:ribosome small subunit-dependent GTPase A [Flavobacteriales bacterium]
MKEAVVISATGLWCTVRTAEGVEYPCRIKGSFRIKGIKSTNPVAVGDNVRFILDEKGDNGVISELLDRKNYVVRRSVNLSKRTHILAANVDVAFLVVTLAMPETSTTFIDRFLASAQAYNIPAVLVFNKIDMYTIEGLSAVEDLRALYEKIGYKTLCTSAKNGQGIDELKEMMTDKITMFSGHSGAGKSSLVNAVEPTLNLKTSEVSQSHLQGQHTTTFAQMHMLSFGGGIIDTPGIRGFGLVDMKPQEIGDYFPEIFALKGDCKFNNCLHTDEPGCAILAALDNGEIAQSRYISYLGILQGDEGPYREDDYK